MLTDEPEIRAAIADVLADVLDPRMSFEARYELTSALMDRVAGPLLAQVRQLTADLPTGELHAHLVAAFGEQLDSDEYSPASAASVAYAYVLPLLANLDIQVRQLTEDRDRTRAELTAEDYTKAIETLRDLYRDDADAFIELIETVRADEVLHSTEVDGRFVGCFTKHLVDITARAALGGERG